jgi:hypothetical protein
MENSVRLRMLNAIYVENKVISLGNARSESKNNVISVKDLDMFRDSAGPEELV